MSELSAAARRTAQRYLELSCMFFDAVHDLLGQCQGGPSFSPAHHRRTPRADRLDERLELGAERISANRSELAGAEVAPPGSGLARRLKFAEADSRGRPV